MDKYVNYNSYSIILSHCKQIIEITLQRFQWRINSAIRLSLRKEDGKASSGEESHAALYFAHSHARASGLRK